MSESVEALRRRKQGEAEALACGKAALWAKAEGTSERRDVLAALTGGAVVRCVRGLPGAELPSAQAYAIVTDPAEGGAGVATIGEWRARCRQPLIWWDHVVDPVQVAEARVAGADAVRITAALLDELALDDCLTAAERAGCAAIVVVNGADEAQRILSLGAEILAVKGVGERAPTWRRGGAVAVLDIVAPGATASPDADAIVVGTALSS